MKPVLFVVTELERPVGGLYRFATEFASKWRSAVPKVELQQLGFKDPFAPLEKDLKPAQGYSSFRHKVYAGQRAGRQALFIEPVPSEGEVEKIQEELWRDYGVRSLKENSWDYYRTLCGFWSAVPEFIEYSRRQLGREYSLVDCQDWLAFPAGFMARKKLSLPLHCRFHSTEFGRSMGNPDTEAAPFSIETAALLEADFIQGVSVSEAKFLFYHYLPFAERLRDSLSPSKPSGWAAYVNDKFEDYQNFLVYEPDDLVLYTGWAAGIPNGIILDEWTAVTASDIARGKQLLRELLPGKKRSMLFVGRTETRKGIAQLIEALTLLDDESVGLVIVSSFSPDAQQRYEEMIASRGLAGRVVIHSGWLSDRDKRALFCASDIMVFPSLYEPFGLVCLEGLAADFAAKRNGLDGPVVVASAAGGLNEIIRTGVNGFKVPMEEFDLKPELLARVLRMALRNKASAHPVSAGGARRVQEHFFNWASLARLVHKSYSITLKNFGLRGGLMEPVEVFGVNAGKVWLCLKGSPALTLSEIKSKAKLSTEQASAALGWLGRENKIYVENAGKARKYGLRE